MDIRPFVGIEIVLAMIVCAMIIWRKLVARREDDQLHVLHSEGLAPQQAVVAEKLDLIDKWGKIATVVAVVFGLLVAALWIYQVWVQGSTQPSLGA